MFVLGLIIRAPFILIAIVIAAVIEAGWYLSDRFETDESLVDYVKSRN